MPTSKDLKKVEFPAFLRLEGVKMTSLGVTWRHPM